jgi:hypothetical protein
VAPERDGVGLHVADIRIFDAPYRHSWVSE